MQGSLYFLGGQMEGCSDHLFVGSSRLRNPSGARG